MTAINHPVINEFLKNNCPNYEVVCEDIQCQEGLLEILKKGIPDVLVLNEQLSGPFDKKKLIDKIRQIDKYFRIIIIVSKQDEEFNNYLTAKGVFDVLVNEQAEMADLIDAIDREAKVVVKVKKEIPKEVREELQTLKTLLSQKPKVIEKKIILEAPPKIQRQEVIAITGAGSVGKSSMVTQLAVTLAKKSKARILVVDLNTEFPSLDQYFGIPKEPQTVDYLIGSDKNTCLNYMVDNIDKGRFDNNVFDELVIKYKHLDNLHILTGNYSFYICQNVLNPDYYRTILEKAKALYDFIFIDTSSNLFLDSTQFAVTHATKIFFLVEGTYASLRKSLSMLDLFTSTWDVRKEAIKIIVSKHNEHSLDREVIKEVMGSYNICQFIRQDTRHDFYLNKNIPMVLKSLKKDQAQYLKILEDFNYIKRRSIFEKLFKTKLQKIEEKEIKQFENSNRKEGAKC